MGQEKGLCKELRSFKCHLAIIDHEKTCFDAKKKKVNCDWQSDMLKLDLLLGMSRL